MGKYISIFIILFFEMVIHIPIHAQIPNSFHKQWKGELIFTNNTVKITGDVVVWVQNKKNLDKITVFLSRFGSVNKSYVIPFENQAINYNNSNHLLTMKGDGIINPSGVLVSGEYNFTILDSLFDYPVLYGYFVANNVKQTELILFPPEIYKQLNKSDYSVSIATVQNHLSKNLEKFKKNKEEKHEVSGIIEHKNIEDSIKLVQEYERTQSRNTNQLTLVEALKILVPPSGQRGDWNVVNIGNSHIKFNSTKPHTNNNTYYYLNGSLILTNSVKEQHTVAFTLGSNNNRNYTEVNFTQEEFEGNSPITEFIKIYSGVTNKSDIKVEILKNIGLTQYGRISIPGKVIVKFQFEEQSFNGKGDIPLTYLHLSFD